MEDPSAVYCTALGYSYTIQTKPNGDIGYCVLPNGQSVKAWDFLGGNAAQEYNLCSRQGYKSKIFNSSQSGFPFESGSYTICILKDGNEVEVTTLMNLSFKEGQCGDRVCVLGEDYQNCPSDCPSGTADGLCDRILDGKCDPDCIGGQGDPDCVLVSLWPLIIVALIVGGCIIVIILWKRKKQVNE